MTDQRMAAYCGELEAKFERLRAALENKAAFLDVMANTLDEWAEQSRSGGWSTHQVDANTARANECRRQAAHARSLLSSH